MTLIYHLTPMYKQMDRALKHCLLLKISLPC
uniref:Uncharacterized protein n=1 Tax=Myoviridae sp. ctGrV43 TaxID=2825075 RepID=A0A8S5UF37_9CAUD|nr:MAG TPA: hypothetical protein [Myoviridae sp. ctGrV43]